ncbi:protein insensitive [Helicoverpa armigera]|uniref:protein insensitive n=1 Tax=Helicoverpa armigera TaxID=29058 RepID=UPI00308337D6
MSTVGMSVANTEFDAAQALLDLQSNIRETRHENYDTKESVETAKLFLSCFIASNVGNAAKPPHKAVASPKVGTVTPMYAVSKGITTTSDVAVSPKISKRKSPDQELTRASNAHNYDIAESSNKRSKIFKRKPIKHFTVTSGPIPKILANRAANSAKNESRSTIAEYKVKTRDVGTQTDEEIQPPIIETMEFTISKLCEKIKSLEAQIQSNSKLSKTIEKEISDNDVDYEDDDDDDESYKVNSNENTFDDSDLSDSDETYSERETPEKQKSKPKAKQYGYTSTPKVLTNRNSIANADDMVPIGEGNALIPSRIFRHVNWNSYTSATRKLLTAVFTRRVLATHSLTGKPSPAFPNKPAKKKLDPALVNDIVQTVVERCCVPENVVRTSITTKCADESKMFRTRENNKKKRSHKVNRENIPPESDSDHF